MPQFETDRDFLKAEILDGVALVTLSRPETMNAVTPDLARGLSEVLSELPEDGSVRAVLLTGTGRAFCSGGDIRAIGSRDGHPWRIPIRRPSGSGVFATIRVQGDESVFTSGAYERNFVFKGKTYHHIIDPRTGYPATGVRAVTVVHRNAMTADAAANAIFIAGPDHWQEIARSMEVKYVLMVDSKGVLHMNPEMQDRIDLLDQNVETRVSPPLRRRAGAAAERTQTHATASAGHQD